MTTAVDVYADDFFKLFEAKRNTKFCDLSERDFERIA